MEVWNKWSSIRSSNAELFSKGDWAAKDKAWVEAEISGN
ncbi:conserved protein of unknown function [Shewanella benthica]|uniref:Uncharacterized protein n=1 Tax=Shewanella benthica TaxID=43661 RepID=A0A330M629_9GAMM|nr:conserved protein of unknown function [Shewanella benthica]